MRLTLASILRQLVALLHPDVVAPIRRLSQTLLFLQHELSKKDFSQQITQDIIEGTAPFRKHLGQLSAELINLMNAKDKIAPEIGDKIKLVDDAEKLLNGDPTANSTIGKDGILKSIDDMVENYDESDTTKLKELQKSLDELSTILRDITSAVLPKLEHVREPELETFRTRAEKPAPQESLFKKLLRRKAMRESLSDILRTAGSQLYAMSMAEVVTPQQFPAAANDFITWIKSVSKPLVNSELLEKAAVAPQRLLKAVEFSLSKYIELFPKMSKVLKSVAPSEKMEKARSGLKEIEDVIEGAQKSDADFTALAQRAKETIPSVVSLVSQVAKEIEAELRKK